VHGSIESCSRHMGFHSWETNADCKDSLINRQVFFVFHSRNDLLHINFMTGSVSPVRGHVKAKLHLKDADMVQLPAESAKNHGIGFDMSEVVSPTAIDRCNTTRGNNSCPN